jgi:hypothetical protein
VADYGIRTYRLGRARLSGALLEGFQVEGESLRTCDSPSGIHRAFFAGLDSARSDCAWGRMSLRCRLGPEAMLSIRAFASDQDSIIWGGEVVRVDDFLLNPAIPEKDKQRLFTLGGGMEAMFGNMIAKGESEALRNAYKRYKFLLTVLTITLFGAAMVLILPFVRLYTYGTTDVEYIHPLFAVIMLLGDAIYCLTLPCYNLPIAANKLKESRAGAYGEAIINVAVSMVLVFWNPLVGIAIGTLAAMVFKSVYLMVFAGKHILYIRWKRMIREFMLIVAVLVVIGIAGMWVIQQVLIDDYFVWALVGVCASGITLLIALVIANAMFPGMMKDVLEKLMQKKKHRGR